jgi:hypothetical protein
MIKELKDMSLNELIDYHTGIFIISLGRGDSIRSLITEIVRVTLTWKAEHSK